MGCVINPSATTPEQLTTYQAEERAAAQRFETTRLNQEAARAAEDRVLKDNPPPPPPGVPVNYYNDLWSLTAPAATNLPGIPHPEVPVVTSSQLHASPGLELKDRDWASQQNAEQLAKDSNAIPTFHVNAPIVAVDSNLAPDDPNRTHDVQRVYTTWINEGEGRDNQRGGFAARAADFNHGDITGSAAQALASLSYAPTHITDVGIPVGSSLMISRPISGQIRQIQIISALDVVSYFNARDLKPEVK